MLTRLQRRLDGATKILICLSASAGDEMEGSMLILDMTTTSADDLAYFCG